MDNGEVIPGLNEDWTFAGCKLMEWLSGLMISFMFSNLFSKPAHFMPLLVMVWIGSTLSLSTARKKFPDEERGVMNMCMAACGFEPPGIPAPASLQPRWSGAPLRNLSDNKLFVQLHLDAVIAKAQRIENQRQ
jgi:hypothetical protein